MPVGKKCVVSITVRPRSGRNEIKTESGLIKVYLRSTPAENEANIELIAFLAKKLKISKRSLKILRGATSRNKDLEVTGLSASEVDELLSS